MSLLNRHATRGCRRQWRGSLAVALLIGVCVSPAPGLFTIADNTTVVPLPEIIVDPNEGQTLGVIASILVSDDKNELRRIFAPDVRYNEITGAYPTFRLYEYPSPDQMIYLQAGKATRIGEYFEALYNGVNLFDGWMDGQARLFHENDPFERFYGLGNDTPAAAETNFTGDTGVVFGYVGIHLPYGLRAGTQTRLKVVRVREGGVRSVTQLVHSPLSNAPGAHGATIVGQGFSLRYDTRDNISIPTMGALADATIEVVDRALGSSESYIRYSLEGRSFWPLRIDKRLILASQIVLSYLQGGNRAPFYDRNPLGGMRSLRGYGSNRFIDNDRFFARSELRANVWEPSWVKERFKIRGHLEVAPFIDIGRVFESSRTFPLENLHVGGGFGLRAVLPPQLVAYVDIGTTGQSSSVFTGVDYPF